MATMVPTYARALWTAGILAEWSLPTSRNRLTLPLCMPRWSSQRADHGLSTGGRPQVPTGRRQSRSGCASTTYLALTNPTTTRRRPSKMRCCGSRVWRSGRCRHRVSAHHDLRAGPGNGVRRRDRPVGATGRVASMAARTRRGDRAGRRRQVHRARCLRPAWPLSAVRDDSKWRSTRSGRASRRLPHCSEPADHHAVPHPSRPATSRARLDTVRVGEGRWRQVWDIRRDVPCPAGPLQFVEDLPADLVPTRFRR